MHDQKKMTTLFSGTTSFKMSELVGRKKFNILFNDKRVENIEKPFMKFDCEFFTIVKPLL